MDYRTTYRSFVNSYYLSEGLRITFGLTLPTVTGTYLHHENIGITMSLGAVCVSIVDNAGPVLHRKNAMLVCNLAIFIVSLLTGLVLGSPWATGIFIFIFCFMFSMIGVYGARAGSIGLAGLFVMVLNFTRQAGMEAIILNAAYILCGGIWYMLLSLSLYSFRPYKVTQQALGDLIQSTGEYIAARTAFYANDPDYDRIYSRLLDKQAEINEKQNLVRELLYKSRDVVKETTNTGRITLLIFIDINDLVERIMSLQLDHRLFHQYFNGTDILERFRNFLLLLSDELNKTGVALKSGRPYPMNDGLEKAFVKLKSEFETFRSKEIKPGNVEGFIGLRALVHGSEDFVSRIRTIQQYTAYDQKDSKLDSRIQKYEDFVSHQDIDAKVFLDNFNWNSNTFRHALRVAVATTLGFIISEFFPFGHGYWIMLTIIVILKPAYTITKSRNRDRLLGTIVGAGIGVIILLAVKDRQLMIGCMIVLMVLAYSFMRTRYLLFVTLMTPYVLILLYILNPLHFRNLIIDRILDTAIGSAIALLANILFSPEWAYKQFAEYLEQMLEANKKYFSGVTSYFAGNQISINQYRLARKEAYVALANISGALNRMISEPKSKQKNAAEYHELVVLNYMLSTHIATLATSALGENPPSADPEYLPVINAVVSNLDQAIDELKKANDKIPIAARQNRNAGKGRPDDTKQALPANAQRTPLDNTEQVPPDNAEPILPAKKMSLEENPGDLQGETSAYLPNHAVNTEKEETYRSLAREGLGKLNDRVAELIDIRKKEIGQGMTEGHHRTSLTVVKSVNDQFNFIWKISEDLLKVLRA